jgi:hypothetical protein
MYYNYNTNANENWWVIPWKRAVVTVAVDSSGSADSLALQQTTAIYYTIFSKQVIFEAQRCN